ncbi:hypothetical protein DPEC_G00068300 [Dallia pectoralis]|uniref:Uncharacterized protein n=1 Tax=Dallia pectoralis TaxID=75939 RepID=A0ACC2H2T6_DALPE|nr:hypothetical protein DPEC_G00068300 [Dallia pectoralis]
MPALMNVLVQDIPKECTCQEREAQCLQPRLRPANFTACAPLPPLVSGDLSVKALVESKTSAIEAARMRRVSWPCTLRKDALAVNEKETVQLNKRHPDLTRPEESEVWSLSKLCTDAAQSRPAMAQHSSAPALREGSLSPNSQVRWIDEHRAIVGDTTEKRQESETYTPWLYYVVRPRSHARALHKTS